MIESINVNIDEGILTSFREDSEESDDEEEEVFDQKEMKKIKMEEELDEEQLLKDEEHNQPTVEQEEHKDQRISKNTCQKNHSLDQIIGDKDVGIELEEDYLEEISRYTSLYCLQLKHELFQRPVQMSSGSKKWKRN